MSMFVRLWTLAVCEEGREGRKRKKKRGKERSRLLRQHFLQTRAFAARQTKDPTNKNSRVSTLLLRLLGLGHAPQNARLAAQNHRYRQPGQNQAPPLHCGLAASVFNRLYNVVQTWPPHHKNNLDIPLVELLRSGTASCGPMRSAASSNAKP